MEGAVSCFPDGIRALLVDDEQKFLTTASMMLAMLHFKVATCSTPMAALKLLSGDKVKQVDVVLVDARRVATCGFDFRAIVQTDLCIPVIYFLAPKAPVPPTAGDEKKLAATLKLSTFVIKKPLEMGEAKGLWNVIAWHQCILKAKNAAAAAGGGGNGSRPGKELSRVHYKMVRAGRRGRGSRGEAGSNSKKTVGRMNKECHIASRSQKQGAKKLQKKNGEGGAAQQVAADPSPLAGLGAEAPMEAVFSVTVTEEDMVPAPEAEEEKQPASIEALINATAASEVAPPVAPSLVLGAAAAVPEEKEAPAAMAAELVAAPGNVVAPTVESADQGELEEEQDWTLPLDDLKGLEIPWYMNGDTIIDPSYFFDTWDYRKI